MTQASPPHRLPSAPAPRRGTVASLRDAGMSADGAAVRAVAARGAWSAERAYFTGLALVSAIVIFIGFSSTYFLSRWLAPPGSPALGPLAHVHGAVFTSWVLLGVAQPALIAGGNRALHRRLGWAAAVLLPAMVVLAVALGIQTLRVAAHDPSVHFTIPPWLLFALNLQSLPGLVALVGLAMAWRRRSVVHKRLMALSWGLLTAPAVGRILIHHHLPVLYAMAAMPVVMLSGIVFDLVTRRRIHPVWPIGGLAAMGSGQLFMMFAHTPAWRAYCAWLAG